MADQDLSITTPSIAKSSSIATIGKSWGTVGPTGASSFELPLPISPGRGWDPQLTLTYSSQAGNGAFGLGWNLAPGRISRRTSKGVPRYTANDEIVGNDGEVWMPERGPAGEIASRTVNSYNGDPIDPHTVVRYHPRVESDFALRELWQPQSEDQPPFWLIHGADGSLHLYGKTDASRIADADQKQRVSAWLLCESLNPRGEHMCFVYREEEADSDDRYTSQRYLERVLYGNIQASQALYGWTTDQPADRDFHFIVLLDYGQRTVSETEKPVYDAPALPDWPVRPDPFSTFGQGFEVGTRRLCRQVLMFHHFPAELGNAPVLVRRLLLKFTACTPTSPFSQIESACYQAWDARDFRESMPPVDFQYSTFNIHKTPRQLFETDAMPGIEDGGLYQCVDLYGEGLPGFLCRHDQCWYYREPLRALADTNEVAYGNWAALEKIPLANRNKPVQQWLTDLTGDGRLDWITAQPGSNGFRTLNADHSWAPFIEFSAFPSEFFHTLAQMGDLSGDGLSSVALIGPRAVRLYANRREKGFAPAEEVEHLPVDDRLPLFSDSPTELVLLGNLLGSDMSELCRIRHDEIKCWPNLGHGKFGKGRVISGPTFDYATFDPARVRIADLNGSGAPALIYLQSDRFEIYLNRGGDALETTAITVPWPAGVRYDRLCQVTMADLQGLGCASLILTVPHMTPKHWCYDFTAAKPYLLTSSNNNMGCSSQVTYRSSAQEWLDEKRDILELDGLPACHLPFPVAVVKQQQQLDEVTGNLLTQHFEYRQGYYDSRDREFRGFGLLRQTDCESATGDDDTGFTAPVQVCTWFHTGQAMDQPRDGYFTLDKEAVPLQATLFSRYDAARERDETIEPADDEERYEIARALAGSVVRSETWAREDDPLTGTPYAVQEHRYRVRQVRPRGKHAGSVLLPVELETISYQYERLHEDPMCAHNVTLNLNAYGLPTHALTVNYARRLTQGDTPPYTDPDEQKWWRDAHDEAQQSFYLTETHARFIDLDDLENMPDRWRLGLPYQQRTNALVLPKGTLPTGLGAQEVCFEQLTQHLDSPHWNTERVLTAQSVQRYLNTDGSPCSDGDAGFEALNGPLELAQLDKTALEAYAVLPPPFDIRIELARIGYTPMPLLFEPSPRDVAADLWSAEYGFAEYAGLDQFYNVHSYRETISHGVTKAEYDPYQLSVIRVELPDGCTTRVEYDYHALLPIRIVDANENVHEVLYDPSGQPLALSFHGTENGRAAGFKPLSEFQVPDNHLPDPAIDAPEAAVQQAASTLRKDLFSWMGQVPFDVSPELLEEWIASGDVLPGRHIRAGTRQRLQQTSSLTASQQALHELIILAHREPVHSVLLSADRYPDDPVPARIHIVKACVDGFGRALQTQQRVEPGLAYAVDAEGKLIVENGRIVEVHADPRWRISERVEYNNKGLPVRQFRPFFANARGYVDDQLLQQHGHFDQLFYDPPGRPIKLINAKKDFSREAYHPWYHVAEDFNDTAEPPPFQPRTPH